MICNHDECLTAIYDIAHACRKLHTVDCHDDELLENLSHFIDKLWQSVQDYLLSPACAEERKYVDNICEAYWQRIEKMAA